MTGAAVLTVDLRHYLIYNSLNKYKTQNGREKQMFIYKTSGTCSREIHFTIDENDIITSLEFIGGCRGNTKGVATLCIGRNAHEVAKSLRNIPCQGDTSCPDQLARAIEKYYSTKKQ